MNRHLRKAIIALDEKKIRKLAPAASLICSTEGAFWKAVHKSRMIVAPDEATRLESEAWLKAHGSAPLGGRATGRSMLQ